MYNPNKKNPHSGKKIDSRGFSNQEPPDIDEAFKTLKSLGEPKKWIEKDNSIRLVNNVCKPLGDAFSRSVNTSQIRKFLNEVQRLDKDKDFHIEKVPFLQAKLAYATGRNRNLKPFQEIIDYALINIHDEKDFNGFKELILGIIAYHKFYGGD